MSSAPFRMTLVVPSGHIPAVFKLFEKVSGAWLSRFFDLASKRSPTRKPHLFVTQKSVDRVSSMCVDVVHDSEFELREAAIRVSLVVVVWSSRNTSFILSGMGIEAVESTRLIRLHSVSSVLVRSAGYFSTRWVPK